ncbi:FAD-dependent oxidoreductase [Mesorhizobium sp. B2-3-5]|uniref:GMC family oxidoreductase n=1 Tax=Mesorhizobium sp. B2-3-5 TaxID=2589958 RepID=UPI00112841DC|nr:FAD-dependent oxidoreductase [Mesorhizobium sp. B2-3-5]TPM22533.1 FAD-dependent oxidoreductase [Mesorhizobium sp. B2-3-5]
MNDISNASNSVRLALLEGQLVTGQIDRRVFLDGATQLGLSGPDADEAAQKFMAIGANQTALRSRLRKSYEYIVVGAGAAGAAVARRLAEDTLNNVLLLEAGGDDLRPGILMTESWYLNQGTDVDWAYEAAPSAGVNQRSIKHASGKALGGGTSINGMVWARGHKHDFDSWAKAAGDEDWGYRHVLEIYKRIEDWHGAPDPERRGRGGEVFVQPAPDPNPLAPAFLKAAESLGIPVFEDQNGIMQEGSGGAAISNVRIRDGRRLNAAASYLYPVMDRPNLTVLTNAFVNRLLVDGNVVTGTEFEWQGEIHRIATSREVVLSAGAIQTPKILLLSGIGDRAELDRFGIPLVSHLPGVGRNLQDHPIIGSALWEPHEPMVVRNNAAEANLFVKSSADLATPDLHIFQIEVPYVSEVTAKYAVNGAWTIAPGLVRPASRGFIELKSTDPRVPPKIHSNFLSDPRDLAALRRGMQLARDLGNSEAMKPFAKRELLPGDRAGEELDNLIRDGATSMHHPTSTAKMGQDDASVVDSKLKVYGVDNLRIADASIMPDIITGNTQAPSIMIGERLAEILIR